MHVVAVTRLAGSIDDEAKALSGALGTQLYDTKLALRGGLPAIVFTSPDPETAEAVVANVLSRGNQAIACDTAAVPAWKLLKRFRFDDEALVEVTDIGETDLAWSDISALVRATHRTHEQTTTIVKDRSLSLGRAIATGGLSVSTTKKREVVSTTDASDPVLYLFRHSGEPPWLISQTRSLFHALGDRLSATAAPNFALAITKLRERATAARFDDRLIQRRVAIAELDLLAYLIAAS